MLKYELTDPALQRLARIIHAADVAEDIDADPLARGLEAIATGYSLRYPEDEENLACQFEVYDAWYTWCRLQVAKEQEKLAELFTNSVGGFYPLALLGRVSTHQLKVLHHRKRVIEVMQKLLPMLIVG